MADLVGWARTQPDVRGLVLVGSYARGRERMASDVDVVVLTTDQAGRVADPGWFTALRPGSRLVRVARWGDVQEQRYRLRSGLLVELGLAPVTWAATPLDGGTRRVLTDGHRVLHDPDGLLSRCCSALGGAEQLRQ